MKSSLAACAIALLGLLGARAPQAEARVAFVSLNQALKASDKARDRKEEVTRSFAPQIAEFDRIKEDLVRRKREADALDPSMREYHEAQRDLAADALKFEANQKLLARDLAMKEDEILLETYLEIRAAVDEIARSRGLWAVFSIDEDGSSAGEEAGQALQRIRRRTVHFHDPALDITAEVIRLLNR